jgi:glucan phosphoethanolaminetransferase (alkaline phosphatase superfamily)
MEQIVDAFVEWVVFLDRITLMHFDQVYTSLNIDAVVAQFCLFLLLLYLLFLPCLSLPSIGKLLMRFLALGLNDFFGFGLVGFGFGLLFFCVFSHAAIRLL